MHYITGVEPSSERFLSILQYLLLSDVLNVNFCNKVVPNLCYSEVRAEDIVQFIVSGHDSLIFRSIFRSYPFYACATYKVH